MSGEGISQERTKDSPPDKRTIGNMERGGGRERERGREEEREREGG